MSGKSASPSQEVIRRDLAPFTDPESEIIFAPSATALTAEWSQGNRRRRATFRATPDGTVVSEQGRELKYRAFFAGETMADLDSLANGTLRLHRSDEHFVEGPARLTGNHEGRESGAIQTLLDAVGDPGVAAATRMVFLRADAGVGKTTTLRQLCYVSAARVLDRSAVGIFLFIDAQGRGLRRLDEAVAVALDDLRHPLTYHAVPTLTRLGLLIPVIDGFDELIGASGTFEAAFDSLSSFVERLDGQGVFLASARSAYYEREFVARVDREVNRGGFAWEEIGVELLPWGDEEIGEYLARHESDFHERGQTLDEVHESFSRLFSGPNSTLKGKPFFVSRALEVFLEGVGLVLEPAGDLLTLLVQQYLERETKYKLLTPETAEPVATDEQLHDFLAELASLMWTLETRELEAEDVEDVADLFAELWELPPGSARMFKEKSTSLAFLVRSPSQRVAFEHPLFFGFFLAARFPRIVGATNGSTGEMAVMLGRSALPEGAGPAIAQALLGGTRGDDFRERVQAVLESLSAAVSEATAAVAQTRENAGHLAAGVLRYGSDTGGVPNGLRLDGFTFAGDSLAGISAGDATVADLEFRRADLRSAVLAGRSEGAVTLSECQFDRDTRLSFTGEPPVLMSAVLEGRELHRPSDLDALARQIGMVQRQNGGSTPPEWDVAAEIWDTVERLVRHYRRANLLFSDDEYVSRLVVEEPGRTLMQVFEDHGVLRSGTRSKSGPPSVVYRLLVSSEEFARSLSGPSDDLDSRLLAAWRAIEVL